MNLRILAWPRGATLTLVHTDHHDAAYAWGARHSAIVNADSELIALISTAHAETSPATPMQVLPSPTTPRFSQLPTPIAQWLGSLSTEDDILDAIAQLSPELQEIALDAATSGVNGDLPSDIVLLDSDESLRRALALPSSRWQVFLHPRQRFLVTELFERHVLLRGGPGTGKTVTLVHRFSRLLQTARRLGGKPPAFVALTKSAREVARKSLRELGVQDTDNLMLVSDAFTGGKSSILRALAEYSEVLVDEGQDLPVGYIANLLALIEDGATIPTHMIAFDANQAIVSPTGEALARLARVSDCFTLSYCYRSTREIVGKANDLLSRFRSEYHGRDFKASHEIEASRDALTGRSIAVISGPKVEIQTIEPAAVVDAVESAIERLLRIYSPDALGLVVAVHPGDQLFRGKWSRIDPRCAVLTPAEAKGREFLAGVVLDLVRHEDIRRDAATAASYRAISGLYVALTRFRDRVDVISTSPSSPLVTMQGSNG